MSSVKISSKKLYEMCTDSLEAALTCYKHEIAAYHERLLREERERCTGFFARLFRLAPVEDIGWLEERDCEVEMNATDARYAYARYDERVHVIERLRALCLLGEDVYLSCKDAALLSKLQRST